MIRIAVLLLSSAVIVSGCGGQASGSQESETRLAADAPIAPNASGGVEVYRGGKASDSPVDVVLAEEEADAAPQAEDQVESELDESPPNLLGNHLWVEGEAKILNDEAEKSVSTGFAWVEPTEPVQAEPDLDSSETPSLEEELKAFRAEQSKILEEMKALRAQAEQDRLAAAKEAEALRAQVAEENTLARAQAHEEVERMRKEAEVARVQAEKDNAAATTKALAELEHMKAEAEKERLAALAEVEAIRAQVEKDNAAATAKALDESERMKAEAEKERLAALAESESLRLKAAEDEAARKKEVERLAKEAEAKQLASAASAEAARHDIEAIAKARAEAEAALIQARTQAEAEAKPEPAPEPVKVAAVPKPQTKARSTRPAGVIEVAGVNLGAQRDGVFGVELAGKGLVENLAGEKIELAAYFYDAAGKPLKDSDKINRSSKGQVYVGKETVASSNTFEMKDTLFIPFDQLELAEDMDHTVQVELVVWEYSLGAGSRLAGSGKTPFQHSSNAERKAIEAQHRSDLSGVWRQDDMLIRITQDNEIISVDGLTIVPHTIIAETWGYERGRLEGSMTNRRKVPPMTRVWNFDLRVSEDGNTLSGTFHRADKKGNFGFDSEPFVWTRVN